MTAGSCGDNPTGTLVPLSGSMENHIAGGVLSGPACPTGGAVGTGAVGAVGAEVDGGTEVGEDGVDGADEESEAGADGIGGTVVGVPLDDGALPAGAVGAEGAAGAEALGVPVPTAEIPPLSINMVCVGGSGGFGAGGAGIDAAGLVPEFVGVVG